VGVLLDEAARGKQRLLQLCLLVGSVLKLCLFRKCTQQTVWCGRVVWASQGGVGVDGGGRDWASRRAWASPSGSVRSKAWGTGLIGRRHAL